MSKIAESDPSTSLGAMWTAYRRSRPENAESCPICRTRPRLVALVLIYKIETAHTESGEGVGAALTSAYAYDHDKQRVTMYDGSATSTYPNRYFSKTGATSTRYIFAGGEVVATITADGTSTTTSYVHTDHLGSTQVVSNASSTEVQALDYYPFGSLRIDDTTSVDVSKKFTGHEFDRDTDLTYAGARYYDQDIGKWISMDPASRDNPRQFLLDPQQLNSGRTMGGSNSGFASGWNQNTQSRGSSISQAEWLADPQIQNSYGYAKNPAGKRQFLLDVLDSIIFDDDAFKKNGQTSFYDFVRYVARISLLSRSVSGTMPKTTKKIANKVISPPDGAMPDDAMSPVPITIRINAMLVKITANQYAHLFLVA